MRISSFITFKLAIQEIALILNLIITQLNDEMKKVIENIR